MLKEGCHINDDNEIVENGGRYYEEISGGGENQGGPAESGSATWQLPSPLAQGRTADLAYQKNDQPPSSSSSSVSSVAFSDSGADSGSEVAA